MAGTQLASTAAARSIAVVAAKVSGSLVPTPYTSEDSARGTHGSDQPEHDAEQRHSQPAAHHYPHKTPAVGSQGHPDADLVGALSHGESHDAVEALSSQRERHQREQTQQRHLETPVVHRVGHHGRKHLWSGDRQVAVEHSHLGTQRREQLQRISATARMATRSCGRAHCSTGTITMGTGAASSPLVRTSLNTPTMSQGLSGPRICLSDAPPVRREGGSGARTPR